jgi:hypothetical protein
MIEGWYNTVAAILEFQEICGLNPVSDGDQFDRAAVELERACEEATLKKDEGHRQIYEAKILIRGKITRLEIYVSLAERDEGAAPQVVRVRKKGGSRSGKKRRK